MVELRAIEANPQASPTASTRFSGTDRVLVEIEYQALGGQTPEIKVDLLNAKGDLLRTLPTSPPADGRVRMPLPINSLANSTYVLAHRSGGRRAHAPSSGSHSASIDRQMMTMLRRARAWAIRIAVTVVLAIVLLAIGGALNAASRAARFAAVARAATRLELRASEITPAFTLDPYLAREEAVFHGSARPRSMTVVSHGANAVMPKPLRGRQPQPSRSAHVSLAIGPRCCRRRLRAVVRCSFMA